MADHCVEKSSVLITGGVILLASDLNLIQLASSVFHFAFHSRTSLSTLAHLALHAPASHCTFHTCT